MLTVRICVRAKWMAVLMVSSVDRFCRYANYRGSKVAEIDFFMWVRNILSKDFIIIGVSVMGR